MMLWSGITARTRARLISRYPEVKRRDSAFNLLLCSGFIGAQCRAIEGNANVCMASADLSLLKQKRRKRERATDEVREKEQ